MGVTPLCFSAKHLRYVGIVVPDPLSCSACEPQAMGGKTSSTLPFLFPVLMSA